MSLGDAPKIGPAIQRERRAQHLTLERLAALSGVSKSMLSQIERGESGPTFAVLWALTRALKIDLSELVAGDAAHQDKGLELVTLAHTPEIRDPEGAWTLRILSPPATAGRVEWYEVDIAPGCKLQSAPHAVGTVEHLTALSDGLVVETRLGRQELKAGETARYRVDVDHAIINEAPGAARALMVVLYT